MARAGPVAAAVLLLAGCSGTDAEPTVDPSPSPPATSTGEQPAPTSDDRRGPAHRPAYDAALSEPVEDSLYPEVGDPGVDALHYDLDLAWDPDRSVLTGRQRLVLRATGTDSELRLDLAQDLSVRAVRVDGERVRHTHRGKDLVVASEVVADERYVVEIDYAGEPGPVPAPTTRLDVPGVGWTVTPDGSVWTMQEPYGAYTWYAVNDQPSDKALYDFTLRVPAPMVGVANGELESRRTRAGRTVTRWSLDEPASSYLTTVAFSEFETARLTSASGVPVSIWIIDEEADRLPELRRSTIEALDWTEERLGPYPFDSLGFLFTQSGTGMETQTMITLGTNDYTTSLPVLVHEVVHQWWGNQVSPTDWRDLWMNEGMTMYLQALFESEHGGGTLEATLAEWRGFAQQLRDEAGPPGDYDPQAFAEGNVYYLPALLWHDVRERIGEEEFFRLVRDWPASRDNENADREEIVAWWERESGEELSDLFESHLLDEQQP